MSLWQAIADRLSRTQAKPVSVGKPVSLGGGCINQAWWLPGRDGGWFIKVNGAEYEPMFEAEALALEELAATGTITVPRPLCRGRWRDQTYLVLEYLPLSHCGSLAAETLGRQLAELHRRPMPYFGWQRDNTIGTTLQPNPRYDHWTAFWAEQRLGFQLELARQRGERTVLLDKGQRLVERLPNLLDHHTFPSLVHGDLWSGNMACTPLGQPVIFDPAAYYGDREVDLAMSELFGGFSPRFYAAYREAYPLAEGYKTRRTLYNLYH
ncbi:MAG: fructosamine kinase family protein, partial [Candidatus Competibacteraceae bacterium]|nr:fructosamine kinase family protein [Candidatus Competibacteraceae bacterium]